MIKSYTKERKKHNKTHADRKFFLPKVGLGLVCQGGFILEVIQIDLHCHLEVTVAQQGHFGIKSTVAQKR